MKDFLSVFMNTNQNPSDLKIQELRTIFENVIHRVLTTLGNRPFHIKAGLNAAVFDSVFVAFATNPDKIPTDLKARYEALLESADYKTYILSGTTDEEVVTKRLNEAQKILFG